ncbi:polygalacturonase-like [Prosopis cineraria]|uniref:polygalacturonase-like n=1 Tax=Prosopis cineraria TaxID=364024 RepID=UPI00240F9283|nr:polygalacturonase-like [Prosopis cineraria]
MRIITCALFLFLISTVVTAQKKVLDIATYGGKPNGDITQALTKVWGEACTGTDPVRIYIKNAKYRMGDVQLKGPCKAPTIEIYNEGTIEAPGDMTLLHGAPQWFRVENVDNFTLSGRGTFDGLGPSSWHHNNCAKNVHTCKMLTMNFGFSFLNNSVIRDVTSKDSKNFHVNVSGCNSIEFNNFKIDAPEDSPNTDGIHIGRSVDVKILHTKIGTGDDCISLGDGSVNVTVEDVTCGPGHGISVGSVGKFTYETPIDKFTVKNCTISNTMNGVRIKTWPAAPGTITITNMHFEDIIMNNVSNPVIIDQEYCPWNQCNKKIPSKIKISNVTFKNIRGTSGTKEGVTLICSSGVPCENVELSDVKLTFNGSEVVAKCSNAKPKVTGVAPACEAGAAAAA